MAKVVKDRRGMLHAGDAPCYRPLIGGDRQLGDSVLGVGYRRRGVAADVGWARGVAVQPGDSSTSIGRCVKQFVKLPLGVRWGWWPLRGQSLPCTGVWLGSTALWGIPSLWAGCAGAFASKLCCYGAGRAKAYTCGSRALPAKRPVAIPKSQPIKNPHEAGFLMFSDAASTT